MTAPSDSEKLELQPRVHEWMLECFGAEIAADKVERSDRFIEEALELTQAVGYSAERAHALVDYVFGRAVGEPSQEVGGVMITLAALCNTFDLDIQSAVETELARITQPEIVLKIRAKQAAKPTGSALPISLACAPDSDRQQGDDPGNAMMGRIVAACAHQANLPADPETKAERQATFRAASKLADDLDAARLAALTTQPVPVDASAAKGEGDTVWRQSVTGALNLAGMASPEFHWGGDKTGWGCAFEFIGALARGRFVSPMHEGAPDSGSLSPASGWPTREALVDLIDGEPAFIANVMDENRIWLARILTDKILASAPLPPANSKEPG